MAAILSHGEAQAYYDRFGAKQDTQAFYEDAATADLITHADFARARAVFEFGCGTGRFAQTLLAEHLADGCTYAGVDISQTMVGLAAARIAPWGQRAKVARSSGSAQLDQPDTACDRFVTNFVLDLLAEDEIRLLLNEAHRMLAPDGLLCATGLTHGRKALGRAVTWVWRRVHEVRPVWVGGCRPIRILDYTDAGRWHVRHHAVLTRYGMTSEALVAART